MKRRMRKKVTCLLVVFFLAVGILTVCSPSYPTVFGAEGSGVTQPGKEGSAEETAGIRSVVANRVIFGQRKEKLEDQKKKINELTEEFLKEMQKTEEDSQNKKAEEGKTGDNPNEYTEDMGTENLFIGTIDGEEVVGYLDNTSIYTDTKSKESDYNGCFAIYDGDGELVSSLTVRAYEDAAVGEYSEDDELKVTVLYYATVRESDLKWSNGFTTHESDEWEVELEEADYTKDGIFSGEIEATLIPSSYNRSPVADEIEISGEFNFQMHTIHPIAQAYRDAHSDYDTAHKITSHKLRGETTDKKTATAAGKNGNGSKTGSSTGTTTSKSSTAGNSTATTSGQGTSAGSGKSSSADAEDWCSYCDGYGDCKYCYGLGECDACLGSGEITCSSCGGSGLCQSCYGTRGAYVYVVGADNKWKDCTRCRGGGDCSRCGGRGSFDCRSCGGNGRCSRCDGYGKCPVCGGTGGR